MGNEHPVFIYLDKHEKVQIGVAVIDPHNDADVSIEFTVPMYVEEGEDKILMDLTPKDIPTVDVTF